MLEIIPKLPKYYLARLSNGKVPLPMNYTLALTGKCNSRCKTCNIWKKEPVGEFSLGEWCKTFAKIGHSPYWVTLSGGEPFLRDDLVSIYRALCEICHPAIVNIPTNGLLTDRIKAYVEEMARTHGNTKLVINVSIDHHIPERNDEIRGVPGAFLKATRTLSRLKYLTHHLPNLSVGIHTVISIFNTDDYFAIFNNLMGLHPGHYITEIAEQRVELGTMGTPIIPTALQYRVAIDYLMAKMKKESWNGISKITRAFRLQYYQNVVKVLTNRKQPIPCYAGVASVQIMPDGDVLPCCINGQRLGNLRSVDYDFRKIWHDKLAQEVRKSIRKGECHCPLANASYTNMLLHPPTLMKVVREVL